jgi:glutamyl-tRNA synthetase
MGRQRFELCEGVGDFVVRRRDGVYAYQLACVVDDITQRCAFVLRGADLLTSTARQLALAACLDAPPELIPRYAHVGLVVDEQGERLAKRNRGCQLSGLREAGVSPEALRESLSRAWGAPSPSADLDQLAEQLNISALPKSPVRWSLSQE